jgi:hypothetical protein
MVVVRCLVCYHGGIIFYCVDFWCRFCVFNFQFLREPGNKLASRLVVERDWQYWQTSSLSLLLTAATRLV